MQHFTPLQYMKIDIANSYGLDKQIWTKRIEWVDANHDQLLELVDKADEPAEYLAKVLALLDVEEGKPTNSCCGLDATSSGMQLLACLTRDRKAASICNVLPRIMQNLDGTTYIDRANSYRIINDQLGGGYPLDATKKAIMTSLYASVQKPKELFGDNYDHFQEVMNEACPNVWMLNTYIINYCWDTTASTYEWKMPDNYDVMIENYTKDEEEIIFNNTSYTIEKTVVGPTEKGRSLGANLTHSLDAHALRETIYMASLSMNQREKINNLFKGNYELKNFSKSNKIIVETLMERYRETNFLSARILHYIDEGNFHLVDKDAVKEIMEQLPKKPFEVICIHDNFKCHPNYVEDLRRFYKYYLAKLCRSSFMTYWFNAINAEPLIVEEEDFYDEIMQTSEYALS